MLASRQTAHRVLNISEQQMQILVSKCKIIDRYHSVLRIPDLQHLLDDVNTQIDACPNPTVATDATTIAIHTSVQFRSTAHVPDRSCCSRDSPVATTVQKARTETDHSTNSTIKTPTKVDIRKLVQRQANIGGSRTNTDTQTLTE
jgi:hypothetical protein